MSKGKYRKWILLRLLGLRIFFIFLALVVFQMFSRFFLSEGNIDFLYYPSFFLQNFILQLHEAPNWTHEVSGSGDTLDDWVQHLAFIVLAILGGGLWTLINKKRASYSKLYQLTTIALRYFLGSVMLLYGLNKLFLLQMEYPKLSHFYTPLGDFKPMDLAWTFVGYSPAYEFIGGLLEFLAGLMLFFRRTTLLGVLIFLGVMSNVLMLNYFYGVAVKIFSTTLVLMGLFLFLEYIPKLIDFLLLQKATKVELKELNLVKPWKKKGRLILKYGYISIGLIGLLILHVQIYTRLNTFVSIAIEGAYDVHYFEINGKTNENYFDATRWNQVVINKSLDGLTSSGHVSFGTTDRKLANFEIDSLNQLRIEFAKEPSIVFKGFHQMNGDSLVWTGQIANDSILMILKSNQRELTLPKRSIKLIMDAGEAENIRTRN